MAIAIFPHAAFTSAIILRRCIMKMRDLVVAIDISYGTYVQRTKGDEEGLMTFAMEIDTSFINHIGQSYEYNLWAVGVYFC